MENIKIEKAEIQDAAEILDLQKAAFLSEAKLYKSLKIPPMVESVIQIEKEIRTKIVLKAVIDGKIVGAVRGILENETCQISRFCVHPDWQNLGIGTKLINAIEKTFGDAERFELWTGDKSIRNLYLYRKLGYKIFRIERVNENGSMVFLEKKGK